MAADDRIAYATVRSALVSLAEHRALNESQATLLSSRGCVSGRDTSVHAGALVRVVGSWEKEGSETIRQTVNEERVHKRVDITDT